MRKTSISGWPRLSLEFLLPPHLKQWPRVRASSSLKYLMLFSSKRGKVELLSTSLPEGQWALLNTSIMVDVWGVSFMTLEENASETSRRPMFASPAGVICSGPCYSHILQPTCRLENKDKCTEHVFPLPFTNGVPRSKTLPNRKHPHQPSMPSEVSTKDHS